MSKQLNEEMPVATRRNSIRAVNEMYIRHDDEMMDFFAMIGVSPARIAEMKKTRDEMDAAEVTA